MKTEDLPRMVDMAAPDYHALTGFASKSMLWAFRRSPRDFQAEYILETRQGKRSSTAMKVGDLVHNALLEPDGFADRCAMIPPETLSKSGGKNTNAYRDWAATLKPNQVPLKLTQFAQAQGMAQSLKRRFGDLLGSRTARREASIFWRDERSGVDCRCRPDLVVVGEGVVEAFDLKGSFDPLPFMFQQTSKRFGYWFQAAHYLAGLRALVGPEPTLRWAFLAVQDEPPFKCRRFEFDDATLGEAMAERDRTLADYAGRLVDGDWSDPGEHETTYVSHDPKDLNYVFSD